MNVLKIVKIDKIETGIRVMLNNAECVYFYNFGKTIYSEVPEGIQKKTFKEFKEDIVKHNWSVEELRKKWCLIN